MFCEAIISSNKFSLSSGVFFFASGNRNTERRVSATPETELNTVRHLLSKKVAVHFSLSRLCPSNQMTAAEFCQTLHSTRSTVVVEEQEEEWSIIKQSSSCIVILMDNLSFQFNGVSFSVSQSPQALRALL